MSYSWSFWSVAILMGKDCMTFPTIIFYALGGIGPSFIALILVFVLYDKEQKQDFKARTVQIKRLGIKWYFVMFILVIVPIFLSMFIASLIWDDITFIEELSTFSFAVMMPFYLSFLVAAVLMEEFGWRGLALDQLQANYSSFTSSLMVGIIWSLWHFPLYFIKGTFHNSLGFGSVEFFLYSLDIIPGAIIYTWIYNNNDRSILSAIIFHFLGNFISEMFEIQMRVQFVRLFFSISIALVLVIVYGKENLKNIKT
ncbi:MAG: CPBP family intramembrane metalloprotease [Candidatus Lokiarchaeota archaeon]|nr:CPBP family intramembrane metalloprotease [Candidatus Lokiarchaeota archaeon]